MFEHVEPPDLLFGRNPQQVEKIAGELGIEAEFIRRAITEVQTAPPPDQRSKLDKRFLPEPLVESSAVEGMDVAEVERLVNDWMVNREGMRLIDRFEKGGGEWEVDPHWMTKLRTALNSDSGRLSRVASGPIRHQVDSISADKQVLALEADEKLLQILGRVGIGVAGLITFAFWLIALFAALGSAGIGWTATWLLLGAFVGLGMFASVTAGIRSWGRRIKRRLKTTLFRILNREESPPGSKLGDLLTNLFGRAP